MATIEQLNRITSLLREGKVQEAANLSAQLAHEDQVAADLAAGRIPEPPPPREAHVILRDILGQIAHDLGNRPILEALLHEYDEVTK